MSDRPLANIACPHCGHAESYVIDTTGNRSEDTIRRRRRCEGCRQRFTTYETLAKPTELTRARRLIDDVAERLRAHR